MEWLKTDRREVKEKNDDNDRRKDVNDDGKKKSV